MHISCLALFNHGLVGEKWFLGGQENLSNFKWSSFLHKMSIFQWRKTFLHDWGYYFNKAVPAWNEQRIQVQQSFTKGV